MSRYAIVGGGPIGLYLACRLAQAGHEVAVLERRERRLQGSRSIGIHPPGLEALAQVGVAGTLIECGVQISRALVFLDRHPLGALSLEHCPPPFSFVLALPQGVTEAVLEERLEVLSPGALRFASGVEAVRVGTVGVKVQLDTGGSIDADFVVGCDGRGSVVRKSLGVEVRGRAHADHYVMSDLPESTDLGSQVAIYLGREGVVESFPLPGGRRRWVARTAVRNGEPQLAQLAEAVYRRTGLSLQVSAFPAEADRCSAFTAPCQMSAFTAERYQVSAFTAPGQMSAFAAERYQVSAFTAETRIARLIAGERWALAGDAAHVVSPIGGQGMNLGWLGANTLAAALLAEGGWRPERYQAVQTARMRKAGRRARLNMALGSEKLPPPLRRIALRLLLAPRLEPWIARYFTMRGL